VSAVAREVEDVDMLAALRRVRRRVTAGAVSSWDLEALDAVIGTLAARCPEESTEQEVAP
jgi:hypothetical protein